MAGNVQYTESLLPHMTDYTQFLKSIYSLSFCKVLHSLLLIWPKRGSEALPTSVILAWDFQAQPLALEQRMICGVRDGEKKSEGEKRREEGAVERWTVELVALCERRGEEVKCLDDRTNLKLSPGGEVCVGHMLTETGLLLCWLTRPFVQDSDGVCECVCEGRGQESKKDLHRLQHIAAYMLERQINNQGIEEKHDLVSLLFSWFYLTSYSL